MAVIISAPSPKGTLMTTKTVKVMRDGTTSPGSGGGGSTRPPHGQMQPR